MKNIFKKRTWNIDSFALTSGTSITFVLASIVSAIINLTFIGNLSKDVAEIGNIQIPSNAILILISLALEASKIICITTYNTMSELSRKLNSKKFEEAHLKIKKASKKWLIGYLCYAVLAVVSGLNFSLMNVGKSATSMDSAIVKAENELNKYQEQYDLINGQEILLAELEKSFDDFDNEDTKIGQRIRTLEYDKSHLDEYSEDYDERLKEINDKLDKERLDRQNLAYDYKKAKGKYESAKKDLSIYIEKYGDKSTIFDNISESKQELNEKKTVVITESGSQAGLRKLAEILHAEVSIIIAIFVFLLSCMVEFTIYQTSPKVKISRKMLFRFTQYLPKNFDVNKFMDEVDQELKDYDIIKTLHKDEVALEKSEFDLMIAENESRKKELKQSSSKVKNLENEIKKLEKEKSEFNDNIMLKNLEIANLEESIKEYKENIEDVNRADSAFAKVSHMYNEEKQAREKAEKQLLKIKKSLENKASKATTEKGKKEKNIDKLPEKVYNESDKKEDTKIKHAEEEIEELLRGARPVKNIVRNI